MPSLGTLDVAAGVGESLGLAAEAHFVDGAALTAASWQGDLEDANFDGSLGSCGEPRTPVVIIVNSGIQSMKLTRDTHTTQERQHNHNTRSSTTHSINSVSRRQPLKCKYDYMIPYFGYA